MLYYLVFSDLNRENKLYIFIFLIFWTYFELLVFRGYLWRKKGKELIRINEDGFQLKNDINGYGKLKIFFLENMTIPKPIEKKRSFLNELESSYWNMSSDTIQFTHQGKTVRFGKDLNESESLKVIKILKDKINSLDVLAG